MLESPPHTEESSLADDSLTVILLAPYYLPGINGGGPIVSVKHLIEAFPRVDFQVITRAWDLGEEAYPGIVPGIEYTVGRARVTYVASMTQLVKTLWIRQRTAKANVVYSNSFFDPFCILGILCSLVFLPGVTVLSAPRGEFSPGCLRINETRKRAFIAVFRLLTRLTGGSLHFHATTVTEASEIAEVLSVPTNRIHLMGNLPSREMANPATILAEAPSDGPLRTVMFARVSEEKNLKFAIEALRGVRASVYFDVIGPVSPSSERYFNKCLSLAEALPANIRFRYLGKIGHDQIVSVLRNYDLALYPTVGDNFAHVIADALRSGVKVLLSPFTPWGDVEKRGWGFVRSIDVTDGFVEVIEAEARKSAVVRVQERVKILEGLGSHPLFLNDVPTRFFDFANSV